MNTELTFGEWLGDQLADQGMTQTALADAIGTNQSTVSAWVHDVSAPTTRSCDAIAHALGLEPNEVRVRAGRRERQTINASTIGSTSTTYPARITNRHRDVEAVADANIRFLPILGPLPADTSRFSAQLGEFFPVNASIVAGIQRPAMFIVRGDCMMPRAHDDDLVIVDTLAVPEPGNMVAVRIGDEHTIKEWWPNDDDETITLRAAAPGYDPIRVRIDDETAELLGVVRLVFSMRRA